VGMARAHHPGHRRRLPGPAERRGHLFRDKPAIIAWRRRRTLRLLRKKTHLALPAQEPNIVPLFALLPIPGKEVEFRPRPGAQDDAMSPASKANMRSGGGFQPPARLHRPGQRRLEGHARRRRLGSRPWLRC
jgi:hypothetical protein